MAFSRRLIAAFIAAAIAVGVAGPVLATAPTVEDVAIDVTFTPPLLSAACGFDVTRHVAGSLRIRTLFNAAGDFSRELDAFRLTESLAANGRSLVGRTVQVIAVALRRDGTFTMSVSGSDFRLAVPGSGISFGVVGRLVLLLSADNELIEVVQDVGDARADLGAICAALAPG